ncbi:hypothetical protein SAMN06264364_11514 [Quadrisphaera granulorum]|uniref:Uncharacterized protein n=1 Tax=Quadrisphaera granulorum TaxID=317664 RepID=A0A316ASB6_9ACTN|nr:DUF3226 domain-containing protein [Quadrisphaera granulorum]PWJ52997.1 hypothetical protein BXY45_11514 [Quadrisphaera granulorum]SZE97162.1 hypothetical protein SAMN06264364_11514 [Quadrisphaera granulorum]
MRLGIFTARYTPFPAPEPTRFDTAALALVEGADDLYLTAAVAEEVGVPSLLIIDMTGKDTDWGSALRAMARAPEFATNVRAIALLRDADANPEGAFASCTGALRRADLPLPEQPGGWAASDTLAAGVFVLPGGGAQGALEQLLAEVPAHPSAFKEAMAFVRASTLASAPRSRLLKGALQAYLATFPKTPKNVGMGIAHGAFDIRGDALAPLRQFVADLGTRSGEVRQPERPSDGSPCH